MRMRWTGLRPAFAKAGFSVVAVMAVLAMIASTADARPGRGFSAGSRGDRTYSAPPPTNTAPKAAAPIGKSMTQPGTVAPAAARPNAGAATSAAGQASRFGGMRGLLLGGLFAAGFASIFGVGALASALGFLVQALLIGGIIWFVLNWLRNRPASSPQPAMAGATGAARSRPRVDENANLRQAAGGGGMGARPGLNLDKADFDKFEALLGEIQAAYGRNDIDALGDRATPEMLSYFAEELAQNTDKGVFNEVSGAKLLQGDLSEAWGEASGEYATVAMRYSLIDFEVDLASGRVIAGSRTTPMEVTELWTFRRGAKGKPGDWVLSAIQQT